MPTGPIQVEGLAELERAFGRVDKELKRRLVVGLRLAAEPVAALAQQTAVSEISGLQRRKAIDWSEMRVGGTSFVYVAPKQRGRQSRANPALKRPNMANLLVDAMDKAAERARPEVERRVERIVDSAITAAGF